MANSQVESTNVTTVVDKARSARGDGVSHLGTPANYASITAMRARLTTISASTFTPARLDAMTPNDMEYALRVLDDPGTL